MGNMVYTGTQNIEHNMENMSLNQEGIHSSHPLGNDSVLVIPHAEI